MESLSPPQERQQSCKACTNARANAAAVEDGPSEKKFCQNLSGKQDVLMRVRQEKKENAPRRGTERTMMSPQNVASSLCFHLVGDGGGGSLISWEGCQGVHGGKNSHNKGWPW